MNSNGIKHLLIALENVLDFTENKNKFFASWGTTDEEFQTAIIDAITLSKLDLDQIARLSVLGKFYKCDLVRDRLHEIVKDDIGHTYLQRCIAIAPIWFEDKTQEIYEALSSDDKINLCRPWMYPIIKTCKSEVFPRIALAHLIASAAGHNLEMLLSVIEEIRIFCEVPADRVYASYINSLDNTHKLDTLLIVTRLSPTVLGFVSNDLEEFTNFVNSFTYVDYTNKEQ